MKEQAKETINRGIKEKDQETGGRKQGRKKEGGTTHDRK